MHPIAFRLEPTVVLWSHQLLLGAAVVIGLWLGPRWAERSAGSSACRVRYALFILTALVLAGGRLHFVLNQWELFSARPWTVLEIWSGGLHAGGALLALVLAAPLVCRWLGLPAARTADALVPVAGLGVALARIGCFLHGCCFGTTCTGPWCVRFPADSLPFDFHGHLGLISSTAAWSAPVHPLQLYFAGAGLLIAGAGLWLQPRRGYDGQVALIALALFGATSTAFEILRADQPGRRYLGSQPQLLWVGMALTMIAVAGLALAQAAYGGGRRRSLGTDL